MKPMGVGFLAIGLFFMFGAWYVHALRRRYLVGAHELAQVTEVGPWHHEKRWKRTEMAALRLGERIGDEGRYVNVLELHVGCGRVIELERGPYDRLRYLGTLLRRELDLPAEATVRPTAASVPPAKCPYVLTRGRDWVEAIKAPTGCTVSCFICGLAGCVFIAASIMVPVFGWEQFDPKDRGDVLMAALLFGGLGIVAALAAVYEATLHYRLSMHATEGFAFAKRSAFATKELRLRSSEVLTFAIEPLFENNPNGPSRLLVKTATEKTRLIGGSADALRWLEKALNEVSTAGM